MANALRTQFGSPNRYAASFSPTNFSLNGSTDQLEFLVQAPEAATVTKLGIRLGAITGTTPTYKISIQGITTAGVPDGTIKGGGSPASKTFSPSSLGWSAGSWNWLTLDNSYAVTRGEFFSIVVAYDSGTINTSNFASFSSTNAYGTVNSFPLVILNDATVRSRQTVSGIYGWASSTKAYGLPGLAQVSPSITSTSEAAIRFTLPSGMGSTFQVVGMRLLPSGIAVGKTLTYKLYDGGGASDLTVLQQATFDTDFQNSATGRFLELYFDETTLSTLTVGNTYRLSLIVDSGTNTLNAMSVGSASDWDAYQGGQNCMLSTRTGGNWTDVATQRLFIDVLLEEISTGAPNALRIIQSIGTY